MNSVSGFAMTCLVIDKRTVTGYYSTWCCAS